MGGACKANYFLLVRAKGRPVVSERKLLAAVTTDATKRIRCTLRKDIFITKTTVR